MPPPVDAKRHNGTLIRIQRQQRRANRIVFVRHWSMQRGTATAHRAAVTPQHERSAI